MQKKYFRITAYHPEANLTVIFDSCGLFHKLKEFSRYLLSKGFEILESGISNKFLDGSFPKIPSSCFCLQALQDGRPTYTKYILYEKSYKAIQVDKSIYIPNRKNFFNKKLTH